MLLLLSLVVLANKGHNRSENLWRFGGRQKKLGQQAFDAAMKIQIEGVGMVKDLICYCFEFSVDDINQDYLKNGKSTIMEKIQMEKKFGNCQCALKNPKGR